jgi:cobyrinic acid a,c-diamide synthase
MIAGVILNNVAGERHVDKLRRAVETHCGIPVLGTIPKDARLGITERHLGLVPTAEREEADNVIDTICERVEPHLDLDGLMEVARGAPAMTAMLAPAEAHPTTSCRIGVVRDRAFSFYYPDNLEALRRAGAEVVPVDALGDRALPDVDGLYIGGGFPEIYAAELEANRALRIEIARRIDGGLPVYAECAGLMYLCRAINWQGRRYEMAGVIPAEVELTARPQGHGYVETEVVRENPLFEVGTLLRGHEFHHSTLVADGDLPFAYVVRRGRGIDGRHDGVYLKNVFAAYTHLHALGTPQWARRLVALCREWKEASRPLSKTVDPKRRAHHG